MTKILLVEDHEELWDFLSRRLKRRGFDVVLGERGDGRCGLVEKVHWWWITRRHGVDLRCEALRRSRCR